MKCQFLQTKEPISWNKMITKCLLTVSDEWSSKQKQCLLLKKENNDKNTFLIQFPSLTKSGLNYCPQFRKLERLDKHTEQLLFTLATYHHFKHWHLHDSTDNPGNINPFKSIQCICGLWAPVWPSVLSVCSNTVFLSCWSTVTQRFFPLVLLALSWLSGSFIPGNVHKEGQDHMDSHDCYNSSIEIAVIARISHGGFKYICFCCEV